MNIINAKIWSAALRSGAYEQCTGKLMDRYGRFCCLGVAHEVLVGPTSNGGDETYAAIRQKLDILQAGEQSVFTVMNDIQGKSFLQIADYIDAQIAAES